GEPHALVSPPVVSGRPRCPPLPLGRGGGGRPLQRPGRVRHRRRAGLGRHRGRPRPPPPRGAGRRHGPARRPSGGGRGGRRGPAPGSTAGDPRLTRPWPPARKRLGRPTSSPSRTTPPARLRT